jgi:hypothetical protein
VARQAALNAALIDCNDNDKTVNPAAKEICDGKDDNCDGAFYPPHEACFAANAGTECRIGSRSCADMPPGTGYAATCTTDTTSQAAPAALCSAYTSCASSTTPLTCAMTKLGTMTGNKVVTCQVDFMAGGTLCANAVEGTPVPTGANGSCSWALFTSSTTQGPYTLGFLAGGTQLAATSTACDSQLSIASFTGSVPQQRLVFLTLDSGPVGATTRTTYAVDLQPNLVTTCPSDALRCNFAP